MRRVRSLPLDNRNRNAASLSRLLETLNQAMVLAWEQATSPTIRSNSSIIRPFKAASRQFGERLLGLNLTQHGIPTP